jgi:hypothetical protein
MATKNREDLGFNLSHAEIAVARFVDRIIEDDAAVRTKLYSAGLTPEIFYSLKSGRQRAIAAGKLIAALAACPDLEVVIEGQANGNSPAPRWIIRAQFEQGAPPAKMADLQNQVAPEQTGPSAPSRTFPSNQPDASEAIQLSFFSSLESADSVEFDVRDVHVTRMGSRRADVRMEVLLKRRMAG